MKYKVYMQSLVTESVIIDADSQQEAVELAARNARLSSSSNVIRFALVDPEGFIRQTSLQSFDWWSIRPSVPHKGTEEESIAHHFRLQLMKSLALTELIADFHTTRDLAVERNETEEGVLMTRDFIDEYDTFMQVIRTARAALDLPDQKSARADASNDENRGGDDSLDCDENYDPHGGLRLDGQYPSKFYVSVPDWNVEAPSIAEQEG